MGAPRDVPAWVTDGWYANNAFAQTLAVKRVAAPVTTARERLAARAFVLPPSFACASCDRFAFPRPTICYWCSTELARVS